MSLLIGSDFLIIVSFLYGINQSLCGMPESERMDLYYRSQLHKDLFVNYTKMVRPSFNESAPVHTRIWFRLERLNYLSVKQDIHDVMLATTMVWSDPRLRWNRTMYGGVYSIYVQPSKLWIPDIKCFNSIVDYTRRPGLAWVGSWGVVWHSVGYRIQTHCDLDVTRFPYDSHQCKLMFGSRRFETGYLNITASKHNILNYFDTNKAWNLAKLNLTRKTLVYDSKVYYAWIEIGLTWERRHQMVSTILVLPASFIALIIPFVFLLPPQSKFKILISGIVIMSQMTLEITMKYFIPTQGKNPPLISIYYMLTTGLASMALVISVLVINMCNRGPRTNRIPSLIQRLLLGNKKKLFFPHEIGITALEKNEIGIRGVENPIMNVSDSVSSSSQTPTEKEADVVQKQISFLLSRSRKDESIVTMENEWLLLGMFVDRLCFAIYVIIYIVAAIALFS